MLLGRYTQQPGERLKRLLDYTQWLETSELIQLVSVVITPATDVPLVVTSVVVDPAGKKFAYYTAGGEDGETYEIKFSVTTQTQLKQDEVEIDVEEI